MSIGHQVVAWRRHHGLTQAALALKTGLTRLTISKLERGEVDPTLSSVRRLAAAFGISVGQLVDQAPPSKPLTRHELDRLARAAIRPGTKDALDLPETRGLSRLFNERRRAIGFYAPRRSTPAGHSQRGVHASRWLRASLGEEQWQALLSRIDKLASHEAGRL